MQCPKCPRSPLVPTHVQAIEVDRCEMCGGIWFDKYELIPVLHESLPELTTLRGRSAPGRMNQKHGRCPQDAAGLIRVSSTFGNSVIVDTCPQCQGVWLDGGEFDSLLKGVAR